MIVDHPAKTAWLAAGAAGAFLESDPLVTERAKRVVWERWRRCRLTPAMWVELMAAEIRAAMTVGHNRHNAQGHNSGGWILDEESTPKKSRLVVIASLRVEAAE